MSWVEGSRSTELTGVNCFRLGRRTEMPFVRGNLAACLAGKNILAHFFNPYLN